MKSLHFSGSLAGASVALLFTTSVKAASSSSSNILSYVDPLIGTANGGHVFAGASLPFGMAKAVADSDSDNQAGFATDSGNITGFSHMHDDGTGGGASLGNFPLWPIANCSVSSENCVFNRGDRPVAWVNSSVVASPGYFGIDLVNGISAGITVSNRTALYQFKFPSGTSSPLILLDVIDLPESRSSGAANVDPTTGRMTASGTFAPSFGIGSYPAYVCVDFKGAQINGYGTFQQNTATSNATAISASGVSSATSVGTYVTFNAPQDDIILARAGVSFISTDQACSNAETEIPNFDFTGTQQVAEEAWTQKLSVISLDSTGVSSDFVKNFYSSLYRTMLSPQDYTGENPLWNSTEPYYDSYYCIWDSFRSIHPLLTLTDPISQSRMLRSLVDIYRHEGYLPDCRMSLCKGYTQGGSNADTVLADAYLKGIQDIDWATAYEAVVKDAEIEPSNWNVEGRGGLVSWHNLGYIPKNDIDTLGTGLHTRSVSRTVEYAYNDFCISEMAKGMGNEADYQKYTKRSYNWRNVYKPDQKSDGFTGFLQPKLPNGTWAYQDPILCSPLLDFTGCYLSATGHETYEGSCWLYTFYVPQDMGALIKTLGGADEFIRRLEYFHTSGLLYVGDEQSFLTVYQFHYGGRPGQSSYRAHTYIPSQFNTTEVGIAGNDDSGAMGSFVVFSMLGIWPVAGQNVYLINAPFFREVSLTHPTTGKTATIKIVDGFDPSYNSIYIQQARLNGKPYTKNWLTHEFFLEGGVLELTVGPKESSWGTRREDLPPSMSPYEG